MVQSSSGRFRSFIPEGLIRGLSGLFSPGQPARKSVLSGIVKINFFLRLLICRLSGFSNAAHSRQALFARYLLSEGSVSDLVSSRSC
ncbi:hypothetical protein CDAR_239841 [Caerostris darwini]|uniref:Uncharacterized protein n=1 Tax=Caerostris darwini TaxID=1538125 RepID=A0AAV4QZZ1_9ARAC|nr:hypothetical protein CDAR_239841 [Caerostris darwini]